MNRVTALLRFSILSAFVLVITSSSATDGNTTAPAIAPQAPYVQEWRYTDPHNAWNAGGTCSVKVEDGCLKIHSTGGDPYVTSPGISVDVSQDTLRVTLKMKSRSAGLGQVYWAGTANGLEDKNSITFEVHHDGEWHEYAVELTDALGVLNCVRLDPSTAEGDVDVEWIKLAIIPPDPTPGTERRTVAQWLETSLAETKQQRQWESTHPLESALFLGAGETITWLYGTPPGPQIQAAPQWSHEKAFPPEFLAWWKESGAAGLEQWAKDGFPTIIDRDHLIYNLLALQSAAYTPHTNTKLYICGTEFSNPARFWIHFERIKRSGAAAMRRGSFGGTLSLQEYNTLRYFAPIPYSMWAAPYLPYELRFTDGDVNQYPTPGMEAPDFNLPRLESVFKSPDYTDAYTFDYRRPLHSEIATFLLHVMNGYVVAPKQQTLTAKPYQCKFQDCVTLSSSRGKKPVLLLLNDPIDGYWASTIPWFEPLYQATKDRIDWYFICDDINDNIFWNTYHFPPHDGYQVFQKACTLEERAQIAKSCLCMNFPNISFPVLLDDMAQHVENAFADSGGLAKVILIDKNGIISLNSRLFPSPQQYTQQGLFGYQMMAQVHFVVSANVATLLNNNGVWNGKAAAVPDWQPSSKLENVKITNVDEKAGTLTVSDAQGKDFAVAVDKGTRIIFAAKPDQCQPLSSLTVGTSISFMYEPSAVAAGRAARFIINQPAVNDYLSSNYSLCPAIVTAVHDTVISARHAPRARSEMRGLKLWEQLGPIPPTSEALLVQNWIDHPDQPLTFNVDRATEVIVNGIKAKLSDIQVGDHIGVDYRGDQKADDRRPFFIIVYRYNPPANATESKTEKAP